MKIGYYGRGDIDAATLFLNNVKKRENIPLLNISIPEEAKKDIDYYIVGGAPTDSYFDYWNNIKKIADNLPRTKFLILGKPLNEKQDIEKIMGKSGRLEILSLDSFIHKINKLIDCAK